MADPARRIRPARADSAPSPEVRRPGPAVVDALADLIVYVAQHRARTGAGSPP